MCAFRLFKVHFFSIKNIIDEFYQNSWNNWCWLYYNADICYTFIQETEEILLQQNRKLTEEVNHLKVTVNEMSLLIHKMAEKQNIDLKDTRN